jgi:hypothetical protein
MTADQIDWRARALAAEARLAQLEPECRFKPGEWYWLKNGAMYFRPHTHVSCGWMLGHVILESTGKLLRDWYTQAVNLSELTDEQRAKLPKEFTKS